MTIKKAKFLLSQSKFGKFPQQGMAEIAMAGKSNVGKSSLINSLTRHSKLARTSSAPGKTRLLNYYLINDDFLLVDLPGYGFARVSQKERERWGEMMEDYFADREAGPNLCVLIVDSRHAPTADDRNMCDYFRQCGYPFLIAANTADGIKKSQRDAAVALIRETLTLDESNPVILYSAKKKENIEPLIDAVRRAWEGE